MGDGRMGGCEDVRWEDVRWEDGIVSIRELEMEG